MFKDLSLNQFIAKFVALFNLGAGIIFTLYGIFLLLLPKMLTSMSELMPEIVNLSGVSIAFAIMFFIYAIYAFIVAYGVANYKKFGKIMLLIPLYIAGFFVSILILISIFAMFTSFFIGLAMFIIGVFYGIMIFFLIYLFQFQKEMVKLFQ
ncbi:MAG: hypothetical protein PHU47_00025 [Candidatus ainarchaeum sp.]|jgi:hypothetical protein|nr:hypothetical protein [Candidatus ainarchaeum sp.]